MNVEKFTVRTTRATIVTWASSINAARTIVANAEGCPDSAILSVTSERETERKAAFRASPLLSGFLSVALQDLQYSENDEACREGWEARDVGTIWDCPDETFNRARVICDAFYAAAGPVIGESACDLEQIGSDSYLETAGHGAGFSDRRHDDDRDESARIADSLSSAVDGSRGLEMYIGDDGKAYFA